MEDKILETVLNGLQYTPLKDVLVKPLEPTMVTKEVSEQIPTGVVDADGYNEYETKVDTKEVESEWATGIVLTIPFSLIEDEGLGFKIGDKIVYNKKFAKEFDLFKDSMLVKPYDVIAICK